MIIEINKENAIKILKLNYPILAGDNISYTVGKSLELLGYDGSNGVNKFIEKL